MLFSLRSILAVTFLTSLVPLSVVGAPLSQVEDVLERRVLPAGHVVTLHDHNNHPVAQHTLGHPLGNPGSTATVHSVVGRPDLVAKVFHGGAPVDQRKEAENLHQIGEFHGSANTAGHHVIFATRHAGKTLPETDVYRNANAADRVNIRAHAAQLATGRNQIHAQYHGIVHTDTNHGNVHYTEHQGMLTSARFVDWGLARPVAVGPNGQYDSRTQSTLNRTGQKAINGVTR